MKGQMPKGYSPNMGRRNPPSASPGMPPMLAPSVKAPPKRAPKAPKAPPRGGGGGFKPFGGGGMRGC